MNPKKLLLSKWTATMPQGKEKHFIVTQLIAPEMPEMAIEWLLLEAVITQRSEIVAWRTLTNIAYWQQGWK